MNTTSPQTITSGDEKPLPAVAVPTRRKPGRRQLANARVVVSFTLPVDLRAAIDALHADLGGEYTISFVVERLLIRQLVAMGRWKETDPLDALVAKSED